MGYSGVAVIEGSRGFTHRMRVKFSPDLNGITHDVTYSNVRTTWIAFLQDLKAVTAGALKTAYLIYEDDTDFLVDGAYTGGEVDAKDYCMLAVQIDATPKYGTLRIPAPDDTVWVAGSNGRQADVTDTALVNYVANFADGLIELSDGEHVDTALANDGIVKGWFAQVAISTAKSVA